MSKVSSSIYLRAIVQEVHISITVIVISLLKLLPHLSGATDEPFEGMLYVAVWEWKTVIDLFWLKWIIAQRKYFFALAV